MVCYYSLSKNQFNSIKLDSHHRVLRIALKYLTYGLTVFNFFLLLRKDL